MIDRSGGGTELCSRERQCRALHGFSRTGADREDRGVSRVSLFDAGVRLARRSTTPTSGASCSTNSGCARLRSGDSGRVSLSRRRSGRAGVRARWWRLRRVRLWWARELVSCTDDDDSHCSGRVGWCLGVVGAVAQCTAALTGALVRVADAHRRRLGARALLAGSRPRGQSQLRGSGRGVSHRGRSDAAPRRSDRSLVASERRSWLPVARIQNGAARARVVDRRSRGVGSLFERSSRCDVRRSGGG